MSDRFLDPLSRLFAALHCMEDPARQERAVWFCVEKMIQFALEHEIEPPDSVEGMAEQ